MQTNEKRDVRRYKQNRKQKDKNKQNKQKKWLLSRLQKVAKAQYRIDASLPFPGDRALRATVQSPFAKGQALFILFVEEVLRPTQRHTSL